MYEKLITYVQSSATSLSLYLPTPEEQTIATSYCHVNGDLVIGS